MTAVPMIETARLRLRAWRPSDLEAYAAIQGDSRDEASAEISRFENEWRRLGHGGWAVEERASGLLIGSCGVSAWHEGMPDETGEVGYGLGQMWRGRGYATEAAGAALGWAFETFDFAAIVARTDPDNVPSQRVLAKLGFRPAGEVMGPHHLMRFFRVTRADFEATRAASD